LTGLGAAEADGRGDGSAGFVEADGVTGLGVAVGLSGRGEGSAGDGAAVGSSGRGDGAAVGSACDGAGAGSSGRGEEDGVGSAGFTVADGLGAGCSSARAMPAVTVPRTAAAATAAAIEAARTVTRITELLRVGSGPSQE
jgi:hypothetical protein